MASGLARLVPFGSPSSAYAEKESSSTPVSSAGTMATLHGHDVVDLTSLSNNSRNYSSVAPDAGDEVLARNLRAKGWCFVRLPRHMLLTAERMDQVRAFFEKNDDQTKAAFAERKGYGYSAVAEHKEAYRVLTGRRLLEKRPMELAEPWFKEFVDNFDSSIMNLVIQIAEPVFGKKPNEVARLAQLPVGYRYGDHFGMLDFARYRNTHTPTNPIEGDGESVDEVNCVPHYDPGLLSISFFSDREGLQLKAPLTDAEGNAKGEEWVDGPVNVVAGQEDLGVLWLGEAAVRVNENLKAGIHRVVYPSGASSDEQHRSRLTGWYEACTTDQALGPDDGAPIEAGNVAVPNISAKKLPQSNKKPVVMVPMAKGESQWDFLAKVERKYGLPPSKVMRLSDRFKSWGRSDGLGF